MHPWIGSSDGVNLGVVSRWVTPGLIGEVLAECGQRDRRPGALPKRLVVTLTLALALYGQDSYEDVLANLAAGVAGLEAGSGPNKSNVTRARARLGPAVMERLYRRLAGPVAPAGQAGSFYRGMRLGAVDGYLPELAETAGNRGFFGGSSDGRGTACGFPMARLVTLTETGTHAQCDARIGGFHGGESDLALGMAPSAAGMLVLMDRLYPRVALFRAYAGAGAHLLVRARDSVARDVQQVLADGTYLAWMYESGYSGRGSRAGHGALVRVVEYDVDGGEAIRLLTDLHDPGRYPAAELAALYRERWEAEAAGRQIKTFQCGARRQLRSGDPALVQRELWAHLAVHHALSALITHLAVHNGIDPDRISFVKVLKEARRSVLTQDTDTPVKIRRYLARLTADALRLLDNGARRLRQAPRTLKQPRTTKYSRRPNTRTPGPHTRRVPPRTITLIPILA